MNVDDATLARLRAAFAAGDDGEECPDLDALWALAAGELDPSRASAIVDHLPRCGRCVEALQLARALEPGPERVPARAPTRWIGVAAAVAAAAALLVLWIGVRPPLPSQPDAPTIHRGAEAPEHVLAPLDPDAALARAGAVLRWHPGPAGTLYDVHVMTETLEPVMDAHELDRAELPLPATALAELPRGSVLLWRVEATWPDGSVVVSSTWTTRLE